MTLYRESMRRLSRVGLTLLALAVIASLICAIISCAGHSAYMISAVEMSPVLAVYAFIGGAGLAFSGFSFLNKRAESDFYHSIPVKRTDLFFSVTAAAATWMLFTVMLCSCVSAVVFLGLNKPFAPLYPFMNAGYFFAAALLVFAATAIGCTITGTWFTNIILTGLVLFLPRYILFLIGSTLIADTGVISWLDLKGFLDPTTNAATGVVVMLSRQILLGKLVNGLGIVWSLVLALAELFVGALLFRRRPSELAEQGAGSRTLQIVFASLLSLTVLLVFSVRAHVATKIFVCLILAAAFSCYTVYQIIVLRNTKRVLLSLPWFLCSVAVACAIIFGAQAAAKSTLGVCPEAGEIASVSFTGYDRGSSPVSYATILTSKIEFTEEEVKSCVADTLRENIRSMNEYGYVYSDSNYQTSEGVRIRLNNGRTIYRKLVFSDGQALIACRMKNTEYARAILELPPDDTIKAVGSYLVTSDSLPSSLNFDTPELYALTERYFGEQRASGRPVPYSYYAPDKYKYYEIGDGVYGYTSANEEQVLGYFEIGGYIGVERYNDTISVSLETPETASMYMELKNRYAEDPDCSQLVKGYSDAIAANGDGSLAYYNLGLEILNCPVEGGDRCWVYFSWYIGQNDAYDSLHEMPEFAPLVEELVEIMQRGRLSSDVTRLAISPRYELQYANGQYQYTKQTAYVALSESDEARFLEILAIWSQLSEQRYTVTASVDYDASTAGSRSGVMTVPTPTPVPVG